MGVLRFGTFRQLLSGVFAIVHITSLCLELFLRPCFVSRNSLWIMCALEGMIFTLFLTSALTRPVFKRQYTVLQEVCTSIAALAFTAVVCLFGVTVSVDPAVVAQLHATSILSAWMHIIVVVVFTQFGCATILVTLAMLTNVVFDRNVWLRDIDASPSPFPIAIIGSYLLPCLIPRPDLAPLPFPSGPVDSSSNDRHICHKNESCDQCPAKPESLQIASPQPQAILNTSNSGPQVLSSHPSTSMSTSETRLSKLSRTSKKSSISTSQSLVQIPNAAQRRQSIPITLKVWPDEAEEV